MRSGYSNMCAGVGDMASIKLQGGSETSAATHVVLLNLECLWIDLPLGAEGKGEVEKGREDSSTTVSSVMALRGWEE